MNFKTSTLDNLNNSLAIAKPINENDKTSLRTNNDILNRVLTYRKNDKNVLIKQYAINAENAMIAAI